MTEYVERFEYRHLTMEIISRGMRKWRVKKVIGVKLVIKPEENENE